MLRFIPCRNAPRCASGVQSYGLSAWNAISYRLSVNRKESRQGVFRQRAGNGGPVAGVIFIAMGDPMNLGHLYLSFEGRIGRKAYWLGWLLLVAVQIAILVAAWFSVGDAMTMPGTTVHDTGLLVFTAVSMWPHGALM